MPKIRNADYNSILWRLELHKRYSAAGRQYIKWGINSFKTLLSTNAYTLSQRYVLDKHCYHKEAWWKWSTCYKYHQGANTITIALILKSSRCLKCHDKSMVMVYVLTTKRILLYAIRIEIHTPVQNNTQLLTLSGFLCGNATFLSKTLVRSIHFTNDTNITAYISFFIYAIWITRTSYYS